MKEGTKEGPQPPAPAPPGSGAPSREPPVTFKAADATQDGPAWSGPPMTPDAEETMISPPPLPDDPAEQTVTDAPRPGAGDTTTAGAPKPEARNGMAGAPRPDTEKTMAGVQHPDAEKALALARVGGGGPWPEAETTDPPLTPDAILPPGTPLEPPPEEPAPEPEVKTGPIPRLGGGEPYAGPPFPPTPGKEPSASRRALLIGAGALGVVLVAGGGALAYTALSGGSADRHHAARPPRHAHTSSRPARSPAANPPRKATTEPRSLAPVDIRDEKKDPDPLTVAEVFPSRRVSLKGRTFVVAKTVINDHCLLTANAPLSQELTRQHCRRVVRATFVSTDKKIAVTTGIAVMPTDAAAVAAMKVQDPAHYKWFRGMKAPGAPKIDQAGGYAASTIRGRYIIYAYAMFADGHRPKAGDSTLKDVALAARDSTTRPIDERAGKK